MVTAPGPWPSCSAPGKQSYKVPISPSPPDEQQTPWLLRGKFISRSEKEKQGQAPVHSRPGPDRGGWGRVGWGQRGRLLRCKLGPTVVLAGSREGLLGMVAPSPGGRGAGQRAQRTAHMEAINTGGPGTQLQAGRPGGTSKARPLALSAEGSLLGPWALGTAHWDKEGRGVKTPSLPGGTGGRF